MVRHKPVWDYPGFRVRRQNTTKSQLQLTSGKSVSVEEPRIERILPRERLARQRLSRLAREAKEGRESGGKGDWRPGQGGEDSRVMEAGQPEAREAGRCGGGGEASSGAPSLIEGLELRQLVQVGGGGGPRGRDGPHQGGRGWRGLWRSRGAAEILSWGGRAASVERGAVPG